jgi:outer membrane receptor protein involved in Fe transport
MITATHTEQMVDKVAARVTVITRDMIDISTATNLQELLEFVPGLSVFDRYGNGATSTVDARGFTEGNATVILLDGRKLNRPSGQAVDWNLLPLENVHRVEIVRGASAGVLYGEGAVAAVINIISRGAVAGEGVWNLEGRAGSEGDLIGSISVGGADRRMLYYLFARTGKDEGFRSEGVIDSKDFNMRITDNFLDSYYFGLELIYHEDEQGLAGSLRSDEMHVSRTQAASDHAGADSESTIYGFTLGQSMGDTALVEASYYIEELTNNTENSAINLSDTLETTRTRIKVVYGGPMHAISVGLEQVEHKGDTRSKVTASGINSVFDATRTETGYFVNDSIFYSENIVLQVGLRQESVEYDLSLTGTTDMGAVNRKKAPDLKEESYYSGFAYSYGAGSKVYANYASTASFPQNDQFLDPYSGQYIDLKATTTLLTEGGVEHAFGQRSSMRGSYFTSESSDEIITGANTLVQESAERKGYELGLTFGVMDGVVLDLDYTKMETEITSGAFKGKTIPLTAEQSASATILMNFSSSVFLLQGRWSETRVPSGDLANSESTLSEFMTINAKATIDFDGGAFYFGINNLLDEVYESYGESKGGGVGYYPAQGQRYYAGVRMSL